MEQSEKIFKAKIQDSLQIAKIIKDGWNSAYKGLIGDEFLKNMDVENIAGKWKKNIESNANNYVYKINNEILGVIRFGKSEDAVTESTGEVYILYVKPDKKRNGIGTQLLTFAKKQLQNMGYNKMIIWCLKGNKQGSNFYKKAGGHKENERESVVNGIKVREEGFYYDLTNLQ